MVALVTAKYSFESVVIIKGEQMFLKARKNCLNYVEWANVAHTIFNWSAELCLLVSHYVFQSITLACKKTIMGNKCLEGSLSLIMCVCVSVDENLLSCTYIILPQLHHWFVRTRHVIFCLSTIVGCVWTINYNNYNSNIFFCLLTGLLNSLLINVYITHWQYGNCFNIQ